MFGPAPACAWCYPVSLKVAHQNAGWNYRTSWTLLNLSLSLTYSCSNITIWILSNYFDFILSVGCNGGSPTCVWHSTSHWQTYKRLAVIMMEPTFSCHVSGPRPARFQGRVVVCNRQEVSAGHQKNKQMTRETLMYNDLCHRHESSVIHQICNWKLYTSSFHQKSSTGPERRLSDKIEGKVSWMIGRPWIYYW